jgi:hypothetical protein
VYSRSLGFIPSIVISIHLTVCRIPDMQICPGRGKLADVINLNASRKVGNHHSKALVHVHVHLTIIPHLTFPALTLSPVPRILIPPTTPPGPHLPVGFLLPSCHSPYSRSFYEEEKKGTRQRLSCYESGVDFNLTAQSSQLPASQHSRHRSQMRAKVCIGGEMTLDIPFLVNAILSNGPCI